MVSKQQIYQLSFDAAPLGIAFLDPQGCIVQVNDQFVHIAKSKRRNIQGISLQHIMQANLHVAAEKTEQFIDEMMHDAESVRTFHLQDHGNGRNAWIKLHTAKLRDEKDKTTGYMVYGSDITEEKKREQELRKHNEEKKVRLQEIHHRVKNNMNVISGFLELQAYDISNAKAEKALMNSQMRVLSMAKIHDSLYQSPRTSKIKLQKYLEDVSKSIEKTFSSRGKNIVLTVDVDPDIEINIKQAIPTALLANELIVNSYKHAFENVQSGHINILASQENGIIVLSVADDGIGMDIEKFKQSDSMGTTIVNTLCKQLDADLEISNDIGTRFDITFEKRQ